MRFECGALSVCLGAKSCHGSIDARVMMLSSSLI